MTADSQEQHTSRLEVTEDNIESVLESMDLKSIIQNKIPLVVTHNNPFLALDSLADTLFRPHGHLQGDYDIDRIKWILTDCARAWVNNDKILRTMRNHFSKLIDSCAKDDWVHTTSAFSFMYASLINKMALDEAKKMLATNKEADRPWVDALDLIADQTHAAVSKHSDGDTDAFSKKAEM